MGMLSFYLGEVWMTVSRIFLSHSHKDNNWCSAFVEELKRYGVDIWYDKQGLYVGAKWRQTIEIELEGRDIFLLVLTPNSWASAWVQDELTLAMSHQKRIVSILHQPTQISGFITTRQMLKVVGLSSVEAAKSVAASLGLARAEVPAAPTEAVIEKPSATQEPKSANKEYEYFETTVHQFIDLSHGFKLINLSSGQDFLNPGFWKGFWGKLNQPHPLSQKRIDELRAMAMAKGLEELPEKGSHWYSYRFRRKKP